MQSFPRLIFWAYLEIDFNLDWKKRFENVRYAQRNILKGLIRTQRLHKVSISWTLECTNYVVELCLFQMHQKSSANFHKSNISSSIGFLFPICQASCYNDGFKWKFWVKTLVYWLTISTIVVKYFLIYSFKKRDLSLEELLILTVTSFRPGSSQDAVICRYPNSTDTARSLFPPTMPSNSNMRLHARQISSGCSNNRGHLEAITFFHFPDKSVPN